MITTIIAGVLLSVFASLLIGRFLATYNGGAD
jgi:hypothetical protein